MELPDNQSATMNRTLPLPSVPVLDLVAKGKMQDAARVYRSETGSSLEQAEAVLRDESTLIEARHRAASFIGQLKAEQGKQRTGPRYLWAYPLGALGLMVLVAGLAMIVYMVAVTVALLNGFQILDMGPDDGDMLLVFIFVWPIPVAIAIAGVLVLVASYKARRPQ